MSIKKSIANITEKFTSSNRKNIIYNRINSCFDICIQELPHSIIDITNNTFEIQHNLMLFNSIISLATGSLLESAGCFIHNTQPINLKKEDCFLLKQRTKHIHKIIFHPYLNHSWGDLDKSHSLSYGIPNKFESINTNQRNKVGIFNLQKNVDISNVIISILESNNIETIEITELNNIVDTLNECSFTIEMFEHNVINSLCAIKCGCISLMPKSDYINNCYEEIIKFDDIQHMLNIVKNNNTYVVNDISSKYNFENFVDKINNVLDVINDEVFVL